MDPSALPASPRTRTAFRLVLAAGIVLLVACRGNTASEAGRDKAFSTSPPTRPSAPSPPLVSAARAQIGVTTRYDPAYVQLPYPGGDVPEDRGVCTDVVVRALRTQGLDLQQEINRDMRAHFSDYPSLWGLRSPDPNIDHRRVPNHMRWFERRGWSRPVGESADDYLPGDIVAWKLRGSGLLHIGIVSDRSTATGVPLIIHNIGGGTQEDDILFQHAIIGHYRPSSGART